MFFGCTVGSVGTLCGACDKGYQYSSAKAACIDCGKNKVAWGVMAVVVLGVTACGLVWFFRTGVVPCPSPFAPYLGKSWRIPLIGILYNMDSGALKVRCEPEYCIEVTRSALSLS